MAINGLSKCGMRMLFSDGNPLTAASDNVLMARIGQACREASKTPAGDMIDTGLTLRRLLDEKGFEIREKR